MATKKRDSTGKGGGDRPAARSARRSSARSSSARSASRSPVRRGSNPNLYRTLAIGLIALLIVGGAIAAALSLARESSQPHRSDPKPLTSEQAARLAATRFLDYQSVGVRFATTVPTASGRVPLTGYIDFRRQLGFAATHTLIDNKERPGLMQWNGSEIATWLDVGDGASVPAQLPTTEPVLRSIAATNSSLDTTLLLLLNLGRDHPDDVKGLERSDSRWLRTEMLRGIEVDVFTGPSPSGGGATVPPAAVHDAAIRYWLDSSGRLLRFEADLSGGTVTIDLDTTGFVVFPRAPELT